MAFTVGILHSRIGSATLAVLRCYTLTRGSLDPNLGKEALQILLEDLTDFGREYRGPFSDAGLQVKHTFKRSFWSLYR
jgi:hypothetical protein